MCRPSLSALHVLIRVCAHPRLVNKQIGFRTATVDFVQTWTFALPDPSSPAQLTRLEVLSLARDVLALKEVETRARAEKAKGGGAQSKKAEEKQRQEEALRGVRASAFVSVALLVRADGLFLSFSLFRSSTTA